MKWFIVSFLFIQVTWAENSKFVPAFLEAARVYVETDPSVDSKLVLRPDILAVLEVLGEKNVDPKLLREVIGNASQKSFILPQDDKYDSWIAQAKYTHRDKDVSVPEMALHTVRVDVNEKADVFFNDDVYAYFFITDGVVPTGKVTSIYKNIGSGESFFFNEVDRALFPLMNVPAKRPENHLIVDYGIIESDGDDVKKMQELSSIIIDLAIAVYSSYDPQHAQILINLRKEIKALADLLLSLNKDDRIITSSFGYKAEELAKLLEHDSYVEIKRNHRKVSTMESFNYDIHFRLLRK